MSYKFHKGQSDEGDNYADYDHVSDVQNFYLETIGEIVDKCDYMTTDDIVRALMAQLFIHEDFHQAIENVGIDSIGASQHETVFVIVNEWMQDVEDIKGY